MNLIEALNWRYATKRMTGEKLEEKVVDEIIEAARLAPSSAGLQPVHIFSIQDFETRKQIQEIALNQLQITESSHLLVFTAWDSVTDTKIEEVYKNMNDFRGLPRDTTSQTEEGLKQLFSNFSLEEQYHHTAKQAHIALGVSIAQAALLKVDATPMEGFDKQKLDDFLNLKEKGLRSVVLLALGKRNSSEDWLYPLKKFRQGFKDFVTKL